MSTATESKRPPMLNAAAISHGIAYDTHVMDLHDQLWQVVGADRLPTALGYAEYLQSSGRYSRIEALSKTIGEFKRRDVRTT